MSQIQSILYLNKEVGETPLECMERWQKEHSEYVGVPMTYAGRLDPMAEGTLLVLTGEECKNKEKYLGLNKEYEVEIIFGIATDTFDILGKVTNYNPQSTSQIQISKIQEELEKMKGKFLQEYPIYSSKTVLGRQLHDYARNAEIPDEMPSKEVEIFEIEFMGEKFIGAKELLSTIEERIAKVKGDFRQEEILKLWRTTLKEDQEFLIIKIKVACSSGTYMRSLADNLGKKLGIPALAFSIKRTKVGDFKI